MYQHPTPSQLTHHHHHGCHGVSGVISQPPGLGGPGLVSVATQTPQGPQQPGLEAGAGSGVVQQEVPQAQAVHQEVPQAQAPQPTPASTTGKKGKARVKQEKPGKAAVAETAGMPTPTRPVLTPLTIPGASAPGDQAAGTQAVPPTPSPQQGDVQGFAFPPALAL